MLLHRGSRLALARICSCQAYISFLAEYVLYVNGVDSYLYCGMAEACS